MTWQQSLVHKAWVWSDPAFIAKIIAFNSHYTGSEWLIQVAEHPAIDRFLEEKDLGFVYRNWREGYDVYLDTKSQPILERTVAAVSRHLLQTIIMRGYTQHLEKYAEFLAGEEGCCPFCGSPCLLSVFTDESGDTVLCFHCHNYVSRSSTLDQEQDSGYDYCRDCGTDTPHAYYLRAGLYGGAEIEFCKKCGHQARSVAL